MSLRDYSYSDESLRWIYLSGESVINLSRIHEKTWSSLTRKEVVLLYALGELEALEEDEEVELPFPPPEIPEELRDLVDIVMTTTKKYTKQEADWAFEMLMVNNFTEH